MPPLFVVVTFLPPLFEGSYVIEDVRPSSNRNILNTSPRCTDMVLSIEKVGNPREKTPILVIKSIL